MRSSYITGGRTRAFCEDDIPSVAALWLKVFRGRKDQPPASLSRYFRDIFFENPWKDGSLNSLVYEDAGYGIVGFLGVLPRPMLFNGRSISAAFATQFMVDTTLHRGSAAIELTKTFLAGPQDLSINDGANDGARLIFRALRGETAAMYSGIWTRVLRPAGYVISIVEGKGGLARAARPCAPLAAVMDIAGARLPRNPYALGPLSSVAEDATGEDLLECHSRLPGGMSLRPRYDLESFSWILSRAAEVTRRGSLQKVLVRSQEGQLLGWYVYYANRGGLSKVLQVGAKENWLGEVLCNLFHHALRQGSVAICGRLEPVLARELSRMRCSFRFHDVTVLVHSHNAGILNAIHRGAALLSRLDGEWWLRFHEENWT